jgi:hypothetical protein
MGVESNFQTTCNEMVLDAVIRGRIEAGRRLARTATGADKRRFGAVVVSKSINAHHLVLSA